MTKPTSILVRMPNWLGDAILATPLLEDIKKDRECHLTVMVKPSLVDLFLANPFVDEIFAYTPPKTFYHRLENLDTIEKIRESKSDIGLLLTNSFSSAWWFLRGNVKKRIGYAANLRTPLLTNPVPFPSTRGQEHLVITYKRLLAPLGIPISSTDPSLYLLPQENEAVSTLIQQFKVPQNSLLIGINPSAAYGPAKCWPKERYRELTKKLHSTYPSAYFFILGDRASHEICHEIAKDLGERVINLAGRTSLRELIALLARLNLFITNDSGPMHMAAAWKTPLIAIFGSTSDVATGPYKTGTVIHKHVACSPCLKRVCPIDFRCMKSISVEEVFGEAVSLLNAQIPNAYLLKNKQDINNF